MLINLGFCSTLTEFSGSFCIKSMKIEEGKTLKYINANNVLPEEMVKIIQEYVDGEFLYIPRKKENQKAWGEESGINDMLRNRNTEIYKKYNESATVEQLTLMYYLSEQSIRRIISEQRKLCL